MLSLEAYNRLCGTTEKLGDDEVFVILEKGEYQADRIVLNDSGAGLNVNPAAKAVPKMTDASISLDNDRARDDRITAHGCRNVFLVVSDLYDFMGGEEGSTIMTGSIIGICQLRRKRCMRSMIRCRLTSGRSRRQRIRRRRCAF